MIMMMRGMTVMVMMKTITVMMKTITINVLTLDEWEITLLSTGCDNDTLLLSAVVIVCMKCEI